jgi:chemotaxis response regulator CheB
MVIEPNNRLRTLPAAAPVRSRCVGDVLFESVAAEFDARAIALVMTGCLADGATGAAIVRRNGGRVFVQAPAQCEQSDCLSQRC